MIEFDSTHPKVFQYATSDVAISMNNYYIYVLYSLHDHKFYVGFTIDLKRRLKEHEDGYVPSTKYRRPFILIHYEYFINQADAKAREKFLKSGFGRAQLKESIKRTLQDLQQK